MRLEVKYIDFIKFPVKPVKQMLVFNLTPINIHRITWSGYGKKSVNKMKRNEPWAVGVWHVKYKEKLIS